MASGDGLDSITLIRGDHRWRFVCAHADRESFVAHLGDLAARPDTPFDEYDAALISRLSTGEMESGVHKFEDFVGPAS